MSKATRIIRTVRDLAVTAVALAGFVYLVLGIALTF